MNPKDIPLVETLFPLSERDPVFDTLMVLGPFLIVTIVVLGRSPVTVAPAALYVLALPTYVAFRALRR